MPDPTTPAQEAPLNLTPLESQLIDDIDMMVDEFNRIRAIHCNGTTHDREIIGLCDRAGSRPKQHVPVIEQRDRSKAEHTRLIGLVQHMVNDQQDFIDKVDRGEAKSKRSYAAFKLGMEMAREVAGVTPDPK